MTSVRYDHVIVGAGPAGCVLAARLSESGDRRVALVEAGPDAAPGHEHASIRAAFPVASFETDLFWQPLPVADVSISGRLPAPLPIAQGFGVGGGSNIYGMAGFRGIDADFDEWRDRGAEGWGWADVLPYFRKVERDLDFASPLNGTDGLIPIRRVRPEQWSPFTKSVGDQILARGFPLLHDLNAEFSDGLGPTPLSTLPDRRVSAAMAYLSAEVRNRRNLTIFPQSYAERVLLNGKRALGVQVRNRSGRQDILGNEILLACGALQSPALLMRSGVGPAAHLEAHGIDVVQDLHGVGQHLMNHPCMLLAVFLPGSSMQGRERAEPSQATLRFSSSEGRQRSDLGLYISNRAAWHDLGRRVGFIMACLSKPQSTGEVLLQSADPSMNPAVRVTVDEGDLSRLVEATRVSLEILAAPEVQASYCDVFLPASNLVAELGPKTARNAIVASAVARTLSSSGILRRRLLRHLRIDAASLLRDAASLKELVRRYTSPAYHFSCTCRMGAASDPDAVVDIAGSVRGVEGLRVADASIMPSIARIGSHLPVLMIAEKLAAAILGTQRKPA